MTTTAISRDCREEGEAYYKKLQTSLKRNVQATETSNEPEKQEKVEAKAEAKALRQQLLPSRDASRYESNTDH